MALSEKQQLLIECLLDRKMSWYEAMTEAGYSKTTKKETVLRSRELREAIAEAATNMMAFNAIEAVKVYEKALTNGTEAGLPVSLKAAGEILDRAGLTKIDRVQHEVQAPNGIFILPPKKQLDDVEE